MKNLVIDKMENDLMPNLRENIIDDFYLTPDYFEKDLIQNMDQVFQYNQSFHNQHTSGSTINLKCMIVYILLVLEHILVRVYQEFYRQLKY